MNSPGKVRRNPEKILFIVVTIGVVICISLSALLHYYLNSNYFRSFLEDILEGSLARSVTIGSLSVGLLSGVVMGDLVITEQGSGDEFIILPRAEVNWSIVGLLGRRIERVTVIKPKIIINLNEGSATGTGGERPALPISIKRIEVEDGEVIVDSADIPPITVGPIDLIFDEIGEEGRGVAALTAFLPEFDTEFSLKATVDLKGLDIDSGHVDVGSIDLWTLSSGRLPTLKEGMIRGALRSTLDIAKDEGGGIGIDYTGLFENVGISSGGSLAGGASGELKARVSIPRDFGHVRVTAEADATTSVTRDEERHEMAFSGRYDLKGRDLTIEEASLSSTLFGYISAAGNLKDFPSNRVAYAIDLETEKTSLSKMSSYLLIPLGYGSEDLHYSGTMSGRARVEGSLATRVKFQSEITVGGLSVDGGSIKVDVKDRAIRLSSRGSYGAEEDRLEFEFIEANLDGIRPVTIRGALEGISSSLPDFDFSVKMEDLPVGELEDILNGSMGVDFLAPEMEGRVDVAVAVKGVMGPHKGAPSSGTPYNIRGSVNVALKEGGFSSSDGAMIGEGIEANLSSGFNLLLPKRNATFDITARGGGFELLLGSFYGDFTEREALLSLRGEYSGVSDSVTISRAEVELAGLITAKVSADITDLTTSPLFDASLRLDILSLQKVYDSFIRETFREGAPFLSTLNLDGAASIGFKASGSLDGFKARGEMNVYHAAITGEESGLSVAGINILLPIDIAYPEVREERGVERFGSLYIDTISWDKIEIDDLSLSPSIWQNNLLFRDEITFPLFSGKVRFDNLYYRDLLSEERELLITLVLDDIDLTDVSASLGLPPFSGSLSGTIPMARFAETSLTTEGEIVMRLFGGEMMVTGIAVENIFTPITSIGSSFEFSDIDLGLMTDAFEFGRVTGVLQGYVRDLVITGGQPESFEAHIETVPRRGVGQRISVKALRKISIFGSDATDSVLSSGIYRFFKEYRYGRMGFSGRLKDDNFLLTGIEAEGDKGYLIKGALLPPRVDVVSYSQNISFKELLNRIKRVQAIE
ncbi:MAG: hypothetical protein GY721_07740 [Deltaproteobacteria bacterium]|nr:hypothetical protein [Deltaproteobacteria bacterium]